MSNTSEWLHFHPNNPNNNNNNNNPSMGVGQVAPSYAATSPPDPFFSGPGTTAALQPGPARSGPDGRVTKPARRRTRASRRTPTTLLNTDASNFRAMVQQFTGGPSNSFQAPPVYGVGPGLGYGAQHYNNNNNNNTIVNAANMFMQRPTGDYNNNNNNYNYNPYATSDNPGTNNNNVNGGSSSSENRSSNNNNNNFQF